MKVDFNNLRAQAAFALDDLTKELNNSIMPEMEYASHTMPNGRTKNFQGNILLHADDIQKHMDELRSLVMNICMVFEPGDDNFKDMCDNIKENGGVCWFNPQDDEQ